MKNKQKGYEDLLGELQNETIDLVSPQMLKIHLPKGEHKYGTHFNKFKSCLLQLWWQNNLLGINNSKSKFHLYFTKNVGKMRNTSVNICNNFFWQSFNIERIVLGVLGSDILFN